VEDQQQVVEQPMGPGLLEAAWRYRWLIVAVTLLGALAGYGASLLQTPMYEATARLLLADPRNSGEFGDRLTLDPSRYIRNRAEVARSTPVMLRAVEIIDGRLSVPDLRGQVTVQPSADLDLLTIRALDLSPRAAAELADAMAKAYQHVVTAEVIASADRRIAELDDTQVELQNRVRTLEAQLDRDPDDATARAQRDAALAQLVNLESRSEQIAVDAALFGAGVELYEAPEVPRQPAQPRPLRNAAVAAVLGVLASAAFAWWRAEDTQKAERRQDAAPVLRAPLLGEVIDFGTAGVAAPVPTVTAPKSVAAEAYHFVVSSLEYALEGRSGTTLVVTSPGQADGKTTTALNLAVAAAQDGRRVQLVDADERVRGLTKLSQVDPEPGLTDLADERIPVEDCVASWRLTDTLRILLVPAGREVADPAGFFRTPAFRKAMVRLRDTAELTIVDAPPLLAVSDTSAVAGQADGIVLVVIAGTPLKTLAAARERLDFVGTPLLGYVFNRSRFRGGGYYGYGYGYGYAYGEAPSRRWLARLLRRGRPPSVADTTVSDMTARAPEKAQAGAPEEGQAGAP
jgi:Mrp family chromosome partitioning ATPase/capsular polysaccharide biosynthesis protein